MSINKQLVIFSKSLRGHFSALPGRLTRRFPISNVAVDSTALCRGQRNSLELMDEQAWFTTRTALEIFMKTGTVTFVPYLKEHINFHSQFPQFGAGTAQSV